MKAGAQRGSVALSLMMTILLLGLGAVMGVQLQTHRWQKVIHNEFLYLKAFHQAESSLAWGLTLRWRGIDGECRCQPDDRLRVCLGDSGRAGNWVLAGEGQQDGQGQALQLFRLVRLRAGPDETGNSEGYRLSAISAGWLDYFPGERRHGTQKTAGGGNA